MGRKRSSKTQQTSKSKFTEEALVAADLISGSVDDSLFFFFPPERTMRRLSLRFMRYMQWMCLSAPGRGRWEQNLCFIWKKMNAFTKVICFARQAKDGGQRTTVYKRDPNRVYGLKMKTSRTFFSEMERRFDTMPFTLRYNLLNLKPIDSLPRFHCFVFMPLHRQ